jgi:hypothetical protein
MQVIIKKENGWFYLQVLNVYGYLKYSYASKSYADILQAIYKLIDSKIIKLHSKSIHFINFIKPIVIESNLKVYNHKAKEFNKNYSNDKNRENKLELRAIAQDFLRQFKITKKIENFYNYLFYCNAYKDFTKVKSIMAIKDFSKVVYKNG